MDWNFGSLELVYTHEHWTNAPAILAMLIQAF